MKAGTVAAATTAVAASGWVALGIAVANPPAAEAVVEEALPVSTLDVTPTPTPPKTKPVAVKKKPKPAKTVTPVVKPTPKPAPAQQAAKPAKSHGS